LLNICSWLGEYDAKTIWIESGHDRFAESMDQEEIYFLCGARDITHIEDTKTFPKNDAVVQIKPEKNRYQETHLVGAVINHDEENLVTTKLETVGENGDKKVGIILGLEKVDDTESISDEKEGEVDNLVEKGREKQLEEELEVVERDDEEEEYYLIEEIIEEGEEEEVRIVENECGPTGEGLKDDVEHCQVVKKQCKRKEYEVFVGGLHGFATREDIYNVFSQVGEVKSIRMAMDRWSNKNRGYAFVRYGTVEQAKQALTELKNPMVCSLHILICI
jgi:RNA recognition motif. (a.k.a. RRM, RBD, or RNP domain)